MLKETEYADVAEVQQVTTGDKKTAQNEKCVYTEIQKKPLPIITLSRKCETMSENDGQTAYNADSIETVVFVNGYVVCENVGHDSVLCAKIMFLVYILFFSNHFLSL